MKEIMKDRLAGLLTVCMNVNCKTFHAFFEYQAHISCVTVRVYVNGWSDGCDQPLRFEYHADNNELNTHKIKDIISQVISLKDDHDVIYDPKNTASKKEADRKKEISSLKARLIELGE